MANDGFEVMSSTDQSIIIRDPEFGHVFTFKVDDTSGERLLGRGTVIDGNQFDIRSEAEAKRVWNYAQMQMHQADKIDRVLIT